MGVQSTDSGSPGDGSPIGRRLFLGMVGLGAPGIVAGSRVESAVERRAHGD